MVSVKGKIIMIESDVLCLIIDMFGGDVVDFDLFKYNVEFYLNIFFELL